MAALDKATLLAHPALQGHDPSVVSDVWAVVKGILCDWEQTHADDKIVTVHLLFLSHTVTVGDVNFVARLFGEGCP